MPDTPTNPVATAPQPPKRDVLYDANLDIDHQAEQAARQADDARLQSVASGELQFHKTTVKSRADDFAVELYVFEPPQGVQVRGALVWLYGGIHDRFGVNYYPFIREAASKGIAVVAPEYRGAKGYGPHYYDAMDYGGREVDDALAAADFIAARTGLESSKLGVLGFSHGGLISLLAAARDPDRFSVVVASVPVTNLVLRMAYKGPAYAALFEQNPAIGGPVHERTAEYVRRSPLYQVGNLRARVQVHLATNDDDVEYLEASSLGNALRVHLADRADVRVYQDPPGGHFFNRRVDLETLARDDTEQQTQAWNATWSWIEAALAAAPGKAESP